jgi:hypothetical protein
MNLIAAFQYATYKFTYALMDAGVQLSMNTTKLRGSYNWTQPVTYDTNEDTVTTAYEDTVTTAYEDTVTTAYEDTATTAYEDTATTAAYESTSVEEVYETTAAYDVDTTNTTNTTSPDRSYSGDRALMSDIHLGIFMLMCAMLLIFVLTCSIRCIRQRGKLRTAPKKMVGQASVRPSGRSGN